MTAPKGTLEWTLPPDKAAMTCVLRNIPPPPLHGPSHYQAYTRTGDIPVRQVQRAPPLPL